MEEYKALSRRRKIKQLFLAILFIFILILGWHYPLLGYFIPLCMLLGMGIGLLRGRKWCDWYCPRGSFSDALMKIVSPKRQIPLFFKALPLRIAIFSFLMFMMTTQIIKRWPNPFSIGLFFMMLLTVTTILGIILALFFHQRTWCYLCPIGSTGNWLGRKKFPLKIYSPLCAECKLCYEACPMQLSPFKFKKINTEIVKDADCLKCNLCIAACPKKALSIEKSKK